MIGLKDYMNSYSPEDPAVMLYVASRCSALFSVSASLQKKVQRCKDLKTIRVLFYYLFQIQKKSIQMLIQI